MPYFADCYILVNSRSSTLVRRLLERFLPDGAEEADAEYGVPRYSDKPWHIFKDVDSFMAYMEQHPAEPHSIYWRSCSYDDFTQADVHYTNDGAMILCVACPAETKEDELLTALKKEFNTQYGYIAYEMPPPDSAAEFIKIAKKYI